MTDLMTPENDVERALRSPAEVLVAPEVRDRHRALLMAAVTADVVEPTAVVRQLAARGRGRRRVTVVVVGAVAVTAIGGGLAVALSKLRPSEPSVVRCFAVATTEVDDAELGFDLGVAASPGGAVASVAAQAIDQCGQAWSRGELSSTAPYLPQDFPGGGQPVPHLVACVLPAGFVAVFPGPVGTCAALGLPEADL
jgi:hypothetical protein